MVIFGAIDSPSAFFESIGLDQVVSQVLSLIALVVFLSFVAKAFFAFIRGQEGRTAAKQNAMYAVLAALLAILLIPLADWGWGKINDNRDKIEQLPTNLD